MSITSPAPAGLPIRPASTHRRPIWLVWLIGIAVILAFINLILILARGLYQTPTTGSGGMLYVTRFTDPTAPEWYQYSGSKVVQIADNSLKFSVDPASDANGTLFSPLQYSFRDFDLRVNVQQIEEGADDPYSEYGVLFRYQDQQNYLMFKVRGDGAYHIEQAINGQAVDLSAPHPAPSFAAGQGGINRLRIVAQGDQFRFYLNDQLLALCPKGNDKFSTWSGDGSHCLSNGGQTSTALTDSTFAAGQIGLGALADNEAIQVAFTDLAVLSP